MDKTLSNILVNTDTFDTSRRELAFMLGHRSEAVIKYEQLKADTTIFKNDDIAELDIIYFLQNILWSSNFELIAKVIVDYGMESRLDQWKEAIAKLKGQRAYDVHDPQLITHIEVCKHLHQCCIDAKEAGYTHINEITNNTKILRVWEIDEFIAHYHPANFKS